MQDRENKIIRMGYKTSSICCKTSVTGYRTSRRISRVDRIGCRTIRIGSRKSKR